MFYFKTDFKNIPAFQLDHSNHLLSYGSDVGPEKGSGVNNKLKYLIISLTQCCTILTELAFPKLLPEAKS